MLQIFENFLSFDLTIIPTPYNVYRRNWLNNIYHVDYLKSTSISMGPACIAWLNYLTADNKHKLFTKKLRPLSKSLLSTRSLLYMAIAAMGVVLGGAGLYQGLFAVACGLLLWQIAVSINQITDVSEDSISKRDNPVVSAAISRHDMIYVALGYCVLAFLLAALIGYIAILLTAASLCLSILYSAPPIRLKRYPFVASSTIAVFALIVFSLGFYSGPPTAEYPTGVALIILVCYNLAINTKDLKDYEGDKNSGVLTLPVLLGQRRGRIAIGALDFVAYLSVPFILQIPLLIVPALVFGGLTFFLICREKTPEKLFFLLLLLFLAIVTGVLLLG
jgi:4-hydroxybenzoate polyprenyltransferase